jgi:hypothetical protein
MGLRDSLVMQCQRSYAATQAATIAADPTPDLRALIQ